MTLEAKSQPQRSGPGSQAALRAANIRLVLQHLGKRSLTQAQIARQTGLSAATVANIVRILSEADRVTLKPTTSSGRRALEIHLVGGQNVAAGIDLGRSHARVLLATLGRTIVADVNRSLQVGHSAADALTQARQMLDEALGSCGRTLSDVQATVAALPGPYNPEADTVGESTIVPEWAGEDVGSRISEALGLPVQVDNDANLGALAQLTWSQDSTENFIFVKVGTGIGTGIVIDGGLYTGTRGLAGEIGHTTVVENGAPCRCGNRGCVETVSSIAGMLRALEPSVNPPTTAAQLVASAREGDAVSLRVVEDAGLALGRVLGQAASLLDPGTIVIGGPLGDLGDLLLTPIRRGIVRNAPHEISHETRVVWSDLGDRAEALGAVSRALSAADEKMLETKPVGVS